MQAVILAAGMGKRLKDLTSEATKCMITVNGVSLIERMLSQLDALNLKKIVIVVGYEGEKLKNYIGSLNINTDIEYVINDIYNRTNNIYSLYLAKDYLVEDDTLLLESDLIFEDTILPKIVNNKCPSLALVAKFESWMDGTVVKIDENNRIRSFLGKNDFVFEEIKNYYKTVNIYKFSKSFSMTHYVPFLEAYCKALGNNEYYEQVLKVIILLDNPEIKALPLEGEHWYEIDDKQDLNIAESIFASSEKKLDLMSARYGGYWRYPQLLDFCYLVNPLYPNSKLIAEMKANFSDLLCQYPSGTEVNSLLAAKYFGLKINEICVGNGAAELIKSLMNKITGKIGLIYPTFEEYPNRKKAEDIISFVVTDEQFRYTAEELMEFYKDKEIEALTLINPDNPSGNFISKIDLLKLCEWTDKKNIQLIIDESFVDFSEDGINASMLDSDILQRFKKLVVIKSISKSYGVPGLRLGILASGNTKLIEAIKKDVSIWNINSFGEFFLQIWEKYKNDYEQAMRKFVEVRKEYVEKLKKIPNLEVLPSQANYVMCRLTGEISSRELAIKLLDQENLLIKDLSNKRAFTDQTYIRLAVRKPIENDKLVEALINYC